MSDVVIDSSVAIAWVLEDEPAHEDALRFMEAIGDGTHQRVVVTVGRFDERVQKKLRK